MTNKEAVNWIINLSADIGKSEHRELWHYEQALCEIREILESAQQWIPVTERLPDDLQEVYITWVNHRPVSYYEHIKDKPFNGSAVYYRHKWYWYSQYCVDTLKEYGYCESDEMDDAIEVTAWCPLPEPYKEV